MSVIVKMAPGFMASISCLTFCRMSELSGDSSLRQFWNTTRSATASAFAAAPDTSPEPPMSACWTARTSTLPGQYRGRMPLKRDVLGPLPGFGLDVEKVELKDAYVWEIVADVAGYGDGFWRWPGAEQADTDGISGWPDLRR